jgi:lipopolysaccharide/colanic/teichoic acid biosynthesis glycosyltransferase
MKKYLYFGFDLASILLSLLLALYLRNGVPLIEEPQPYDLLRVVVITTLTAVPIMLSFRSYRSMWRFTSQKDIRNLILCITLVVLLSNSVLFLSNRLEVIPRSVPPIHWAFCVIVMGGVRLLVRRLLRPVKSKSDKEHQAVLIIGVNHTAELYLEFAQKILHDSITVEGIIDENPELRGRIFHKYPVKGTIADIPQIRETLLVHGIQIHQLILANNFDQLSANSQKILQDIEAAGEVKLVDFDQQINPQLEEDVPIEMPVKRSAYLYEESPDFYRNYGKRMLDIIVAMGLIFLLLPWIIITSLLVLIDVGFPIFFWQQRPGLKGKNFRLYKFRTMRNSGRSLKQDRLEHKAGDVQRSSAIGKMMRHFRLDELPQLFHVLSGKMSFIGPRPLLLEDQPQDGEVRLAVRPGISGWAQIHGGDHLTPEEKLILDIWYIRQLSLGLDIRIALKTVIVMIKGSKPRRDVIEQCRSVLGEIYLKNSELGEEGAM